MNHCTIKAVSLLALLFILSSPIKAQTHPCGGGPGRGEVQVGEDPGGNGLAPTPMCDWANGNQSQGSQAPPERWQDHWGAIASDSQKGALGAVTDLTSANSAEKAAMADCQSKGGLVCKVELSYRNQCAAMLVSPKGYNVTPGATRDDAVRKGLQLCASAGDTSCHVYYSACSLPVRTQ